MNNFKNSKGVLQKSTHFCERDEELTTHEGRQTRVEEISESCYFLHRHPKNISFCRIDKLKIFYSSAL